LQKKVIDMKQTVSSLRRLELPRNAAEWLEAIMNFLFFLCGILAVGRIVGESAALLFTAGAAEVIAQNVIKAYTSNGATLSVLLYLRAFEDGDFDSAWAIGAVLLVLVLAINLAARLAKTKLKQKQ